MPSTFDDSVYCSQIANLHSMAWSTDLKDFGLPFRKFCMLWRASMALPREEKTLVTSVSVQADNSGMFFKHLVTFHDVNGHQAHRGW